jgi:hypothetical protein
VEHAVARIRDMTADEVSHLTVLGMNLGTEHGAMGVNELDP